MPRRVATSGQTSTPSPDPTLLYEAWPQIREAWEAEGCFSPQTLIRAGETVERFLLRCNSLGVSTFEQVTPQVCAGFVHSLTRQGTRPEATTMCNRRSLLRMLFRTARQLGFDERDPTLDLPVRRDTSRLLRPLTDEEIALARSASRLSWTKESTRRSAVWALAEAGAVNGELGRVLAGDLDSLTLPTQVHFRGGARVDPRTVPLTDWGSRTLHAWIEERTNAGRPPVADRPLVYAGRGGTADLGRQSSVCAAVSQVLDSCGLNRDPQVRPGSVRAWAARSRFDRGEDLIEIARAMGCRSLDTTAQLVGLDWRG